jgi:cytochrome c biogenesis protein CcmG, thiol:disulfide interchange protein DsbE
VKRMFIAGTVLALTGILLWIFAGAFGKDTHEVPFMLRGRPAPGFELGKLNGEGKVSLASLKGKPVVLNFWASWCKPCAYEHPVLEWGAREYGDRVHFVGMVFEDSEPEAKQFLAQHGASFPQLFDPDSRVAVEYGAAGVPETYFITADGTILDKHIGPIQPQELTARVAQLLRGRGSASRSAQP